MVDFELPRLIAVDPMSISEYAEITVAHCSGLYHVGSLIVL
jgi:hypothetical protein